MKKKGKRDKIKYCKKEEGKIEPRKGKWETERGKRITTKKNERKIEER